MKKGTKIVVGLSGGVDSSLAAMLLRQDYEVIGVFLDLQQHGLEMGARGKAQALEQAEQTAVEAGIPLRVIECSDEFLNNTLKKCWMALAEGQTPNPCHICNATVKFTGLLKAAERFGADKIATGHYARVLFDEKHRPILKRGIDTHKDQSYFLSGISPEILSRTLFPLGAWRKEETRKLAARYGLSSVKLKESQDLCFAGPQGHFSNLLRDKFKGKRVAGVFLDESGAVLGKHDGIHQYTVGQRRGLGFATGARVKITSIDPTSGAIVVSDKKEAARSANCSASPFRWCRAPLKPGDKVIAQVRYRQSPAEAVITRTDTEITSISFSEAVFGVTPGQILVLYEDDCVLGSGVISR